MLKNIGKQPPLKLKSANTIQDECGLRQTMRERKLPVDIEIDTIKRNKCKCHQY